MFCNYKAFYYEIITNNFMFYLPACGVSSESDHTLPLALLLLSNLHPPAGDNGKVAPRILRLPGKRDRGGVAALRTVLSWVEASRVATAVLANPEGS